jgi:hypothetical protein
MTIETLKWLDETKVRFTNKQDRESCAKFMQALMDAEQDDLIEDDEWMNGLAAIRQWLLGEAVPPC